jgi:hypothetical protein
VVVAERKWWMLVPSAILLGVSAALVDNPPPAFVLTREDAAGQARIRARLAEGGLTDVRFVRALFGSDPRDTTGNDCFTSRPVTHIVCDDLRHELEKRLGQYCSFTTRVLPAVIAAGRPSLVLEDDTLLRPTLGDFRALFPKLLAELEHRLVHTRADAPKPIQHIGRIRHAFASSPLGSAALGPVRPCLPNGLREAYRADDGWDAVYLGSCFALQRRMSYCEKVGGSNASSLREDAPLWISDGGRALCAHAMLLTPDGASLMREAVVAHFEAHWLKPSHLREHDTTRPCSPDNNVWVPGPGMTAASHGMLFSDRVVNDFAAGIAADAGWLRVLLVWPQLIQQNGTTRPEQEYKWFKYKEKLPRICGSQFALRHIYYPHK